MELALILVVAGVLAMPGRADAAVGCTLSNPAQDLKSIYPTMTTYREELRQLDTMKGGKEMFEALKERLGGDLDPVYETIETPYTLYTVFQGEEVIGFVHGVNVPGKGGVIQIFLATDPKTAEIRKFLFQRLESPAAKVLRSKDFRSKFEELTLADFYKHDYYAAVEPGTDKDKVGRIESPVKDPEGQQDFQAALRGVRKDLILLDLFVYERRHDPFYERAKEAIAKKKAETKAE